ncbi:hypothetical protein PU560_00875, partial [Georgenia sp. 10Sc9-8]|nr:hypothetical protein [Georgenia halotolerans]
LDEASPVSPDYAQRAVGVMIPGDLVPGEEATFELSSLAFSAGENQATELILDLAGMPLVEDVDIDTTIVDGTDEVGQATVTVILPEDLEGGTQPLRIRTDAGTDVVDYVEVEGTEPGEPQQPGSQRYGFFLNDGWDAWADHVFQYGRFSDEVLIGDW